MINFLDIRVAGDFIYAIAEDTENNNRRYNIKVHKTENIYEISPKGYSNNIIKALWSLAIKLEKKGKLPKNMSVAWY